MSATPARILLAEDDRFLRRAAEATLRKHGFVVVTAVDGEEALRLAREEAPDLMLLDLIMPKTTLHTNEATGAVPRLLDMGIEPFLLASTLALVIGQRLVRRICVGCRESTVPDGSILKLLRSHPDFEDTVRVLQALGVVRRGDDPLEGVRCFRGRGCRQCGGSGLRGRLGIFELFEIDDSIRGLVMERRNASTIRAAAIRKGMKTVFQDGLAKVFLGETTLDEVFRVAL